MLTLDELTARAVRRIDTVVAGFTDHHGRLCKRFAPTSSSSRWPPRAPTAATTCSRPTSRWNRCAGYAFVLGARLRRRAPRARSGNLLADWLDRSALVLCDVHHSTTHGLTDVAPRTILRRQVDLLGEVGTRRRRPPSSSTSCTAPAIGTRRRAVTPTSSRRAGTSRTTSSSRAPAPRTSTPPSGDTSAGRACRWRARRARSRPARGERALRRHPRSGRPPRGVQAVPQGDRDRHGVSVTFMAKPHGDRAGSSRHVHLSLWEGGRNGPPATTTSACPAWADRRS